MGKLLLDEHPLQVLPSLACAIGLNEAIVLQQVHYWICRPSAKNIRDGRAWVYKTLREWKADDFPFFSQSTIERTIENLEDCGLLISTAVYNYKPTDQTKWYTVDYELVTVLEESEIDRTDLVILTKWSFGQLDEMEFIKLTKTSRQIDELLNKVVTETTAETPLTETTEESSSSDSDLIIDAPNGADDDDSPELIMGFEIPKIYKTSNPFEVWLAERPGDQLTEIKSSHLWDWIDQWGERAVIVAICKASLNNANNTINYMQAIFDSWIASGLQSASTPVEQRYAGWD